MQPNPPAGNTHIATHDFLIGRDGGDGYSLWRFDADAVEPFVAMPLAAGAHFSTDQWLLAIGDYLLAWGPFDEDEQGWPYRLFAFDPNSADPLAAEAVQSGHWSKKKFWGYRAHYSDDPDEVELLQLLPMTSFILSFIPARGRGTYTLWNFDPCPTEPGGSDPIPHQYTPQEAFPRIQAGHELLPIGDYVLDRLPGGSDFRVWSFDPQADTPLSLPTVSEGHWSDIDARHRLVPIGDHVLDWVPGDGDYRLWRFDPCAETPLRGPVRQGKLPPTFTAMTTLMAVQPTIPINATAARTPGTIDYMREHIKHVVYLMLESRSFDNVCGWLHDKRGEGVHFVGKDDPFDGASQQHYNLDGAGREVHQGLFNDGKPSEKVALSDQKQDPFHGNSDGLEQMFHEREPGYPGRATPDMGGFVRNNANDDVMLSFSPEQLPILNGLARSFGVSDAWFSSIPGGTDINRAFSVTGSAFDRLNTWEGGDPYKYWPFTPRRQSLWKVLWSNGVTDWRIYWSMKWIDEVFTYHLYLDGQIPSVDNNLADYLAEMEHFHADARAGTLPSFSFLEPMWIAPNNTTSYHPGASLVPGEVALNDIYESLRSGPNWDETLLVVTFSKPGGIYDHAAPPYATRPWPNDGVDGFNFDLMGPRVPAILVSPWIKEQTVFRSDGEVPFDATSFAATLLRWYGIPKARWGMGDRIQAAPTFEAALSAPTARTDRVTLKPPHDKDHRD